MFSTLLQDLLNLLSPENIHRFGNSVQKQLGGKKFTGGKWFFPPSGFPPGLLKNLLHTIISSTYYLVYKQIVQRKIIGEGK